jgi:uncharacterized protein (DUF924 family)
MFPHDAIYKIDGLPESNRRQNLCSTTRNMKGQKMKTVQQTMLDSLRRLRSAIESRFGALHVAAEHCELYSWRESAKGRLAEIIILDQFSRNIYRDHPKAFACDNLALALAQTAVQFNADHELNAMQRAFLYMPYMHSKSLPIHMLAVSLFSQPGMEGNLELELRHKTIIERFGRYPHRNKILGRVSTEDEIEFLKTPQSSF